MGILNETNDGLVELLVSIYNIVKENNGKLTNEEVLSLVRPFPDGDLANPDNDLAKKTLKKWSALGLFTSVNNNIKIQEENLLTPLPKILTKIIFDSKNNETITEGNNNWDGTQDFVKMCAYLMMKDVFKINPLNNYEKKIDSMQNQDCADYGNNRIIQNNSRWEGFKRWAIYLGFGWGENIFNFDPTKIVEEYLPTIFKEEEKQLFIKDFVFRLSTLLPVFEEGTYIKSTRKLLKRELQHSNISELSFMLSFILIRLEKKGKINLIHLSDAADSALRIKGHTNYQFINKIELKRDIK